MADDRIVIAPALKTRSAERLDPEVVNRFTTCCRYLGLTVHGRHRPTDLALARNAFRDLTRIAAEQCDAWTGLAAAGDGRAGVIDAVWRTVATAGRLQNRLDMAPGELGFDYDTGLFLTFRAAEPVGFQMAAAATLSRGGDHAAADELVAWVLTRDPGCWQATWIRAAIHHRTRRWSDVTRLLTPLVGDTALDPSAAHAVRIALGSALARLGMFAPALSHLDEPDGPVREATIEGTFLKALVLRALGEELDAGDVLAELYALDPGNVEVAQALSDGSFGIVPSTAARIDARSDPWDPTTEPSERDFVDPAAADRKAHLLVAAESELDDVVGLEEVKEQVARLKSSVAVAIRRQERGLAVAQRAHHLVFAGPPGTGKTTIARVVANIYCGLGILRKETVREVHRADLIGQHIGETEAKTNAVIDGALDGVLFVDEAYALVATGAKNDFGLVAINTLLARMENDRDRLVVVIAGYRTDLNVFLDTNEGLRSRFTRSIDFPSYTAGDLVEIARRMAGRRDSLFDDGALSRMADLFGHLAAVSVPDGNGIARRSLDIAGNGRFVRNLVERAEEEREYRLDHDAGAEHTDQEFMTITAADVDGAAAPLLRGLGLAGSS